MSHFPPLRLPRLLMWTLAAVLLGLGATAPIASAQVVVYRMSLDPVRSVNLDFYTGGYFVVPAEGGQGSFIFTKKGKGEKAYVTTGTGSMFTGVDEQGDRKSVVRASNGSTGEAKSSFLAHGDADRLTRLSTPTLYYYTEIAPAMYGQALASSTAQDAETPKETGFTAIFEWRLKWDEKQTNAANKSGQTVAQTITALESLLESQGYSAEDTPNLTITTISPLPQATVNAAYSRTLSATGGSGARTWSVTSGSPPAGMSLSSAGILSGTPTTTGTATFTVLVADTSGATDSATFSLAVGAQALVIDTASPLPNATVGQLYAATLTATGGTGGKTWEIIDGTLPAGIILAPGGALAGTPGTTTSATFTVRATDENSATATKSFILNVVNP